MTPLQELNVGISNLKINANAILQGAVSSITSEGLFPDSKQNTDSIQALLFWDKYKRKRNRDIKDQLFDDVSPKLCLSSYYVLLRNQSD